MDAQYKIKFAKLLKNLLSSGVTAVMVSHDIEFCAKYADNCAMFFDGNVVAQNPPRAFFSGNSFYTTSANRMSRHISPEIITIEDVIALCRMKAERQG
jgi:energy-coupling factor transport system ATP-binding protein